MKTNKTIIIILSIALFLSACQNKQVSLEKQAVLQKINETVEQYNTFLEEEKAKGEYVDVKFPDGSKGIEFINSSSIRVFGEFDKTVNSITLLNEEYYYYSVQENPAISYPNASASENTGVMEKEFNQFVLNEIQHGDKITLVSANGTKADIPIGDSYVAIKQKNRALPRPLLETVIPINFVVSESYYIITSGMYVQTIRSIAGDNAQVRYFYRETNKSVLYPDFEQVKFESEGKDYYFDLKTNLITSIVSDLMPLPGASLSIQELETIARGIVAKVAPNIDLNSLKFFSDGFENSEYFFRWTDDKKHLNDGSATYILVQLTGTGELYRYSNEIILAK